MDDSAHAKCVGEASSLLTDFLQPRLSADDLGQADDLISAALAALGGGEQSDLAEDSRRRTMARDARARPTEAESASFAERYPEASRIGHAF